MKLNSLISLICISVGIALCAASGARMTERVFKKQQVTTKLKLVTSEWKSESKALDQLIKAEETAPQSDATPEESAQAQGGAEGAQAKPESDPTSPKKPIKRPLTLEEKIPSLSGLATPPTSSPETPKRRALEARVEWLTLVKSKLDAEAKREGTQAPRARLSAWWTASNFPFLLGCLLIITGALVARRGERQELSESAGQGDAIDLGEALSSLVTTLSALEARLNEISALDEDAFAALQRDLQKLQRERLEPIIEARGRARQALGLARYADLFGLIAQGERRLNRAWAALVDSHLGESRDSLSGALASFREVSIEINRDSQSQA